MLSLSIFSWKNLFGFDLPFLPFCGNKIKSKKQKSLIWIFIVFGKQFYFRYFNLSAGEKRGGKRKPGALSTKITENGKYVLCSSWTTCDTCEISHITHIIWYVTYLWHIWYITYHTYYMIFHRRWDWLGPVQGDDEEVSGAQALPAAVL